MPLSAEQKKHLQENWHSIQMSANDAAAENQNELLFRARAKNNTAAVPLAYSEAALYRLKISLRNQLNWTLDELGAMGVLVDDEAERFVVEHFNRVTNMSMPIHFPPGVTATINVSIYQRAHAQDRMRLNDGLKREAASAIRSLKLRARPDTPVPAVVIHTHIENSPGARSYYQSTDNSVNQP